MIIQNPLDSMGTTTDTLEEEEEEEEGGEHVTEHRLQRSSTL